MRKETNLEVSLQPGTSGCIICASEMLHIMLTSVVEKQDSTTVVRRIFPNIALKYYIRSKVNNWRNKDYLSERE